MSLGIYRGIGSPANIDWGQPVATLADEAASVQIVHDFPGQVVAYALSAAPCPPPLSICLVLVDEQGRILPILARPTELSLEPPASAVKLSWRLDAPEGFDEPDQFEVLRDDGAGFQPVLSLMPQDPGPQYSVDIIGQSLPKAWAVRGRKDEYAGPMSEPLHVPQGQPAAPNIL
jgi:hypothetical protein